MRAKGTTRRLPLKKRPAIPPLRCCPRTPAFRATNRRWGRLGSRKKAPQRRIVPEREAPQSRAVAGPRESRTCLGGHKALPYCERRAPQHQSEFLRRGNGGRLWLTQFARPGTQTPPEKVTVSYSE